MIKSFTIYSPNNIFRLVTAWLLLATFFLSAQTHTLDLTTSGTYTVPQGVTSLTVEAWGGGGGGGGAAGLAATVLSLGRLKPLALLSPAKSGGNGVGKWSAGVVVASEPSAL